jgi:cytochrome c-type biogenesis protein CcmH
MRSANLSRKRGLQLALLFLLIVTSLGADQDSRFQSLGHKMKCACGDCNYVLLECNHVGCPLSEGMRHELAANLDRGDSDDLVLQAFVQKYGPTVLLAPTAEGFNRTAWVMPYLVLVLGVVTVVLIVRSWKNRPLSLPKGAVAPVGGAELERFREQARKDTEE